MLPAPTSCSLYRSAVFPGRLSVNLIVGGNICSARTTIECVLMWKNRRAAARVSENPWSSAPSEANGLGRNWRSVFWPLGLPDLA